MAATGSDWWLELLNFRMLAFRWFFRTQYIVSIKLWLMFCHCLRHRNKLSFFFVVIGILGYSNSISVELIELFEVNFKFFKVYSSWHLFWSVITYFHHHMHISVIFNKPHLTMRFRITFLERQERDFCCNFSHNLIQWWWWSLRGMHKKKLKKCTQLHMNIHYFLNRTIRRELDKKWFY